MEELRTCKQHGESLFVKRSDRDGFRCKKCAVDSVQRRRLKIKQQAVNYKGGCCERCGYDKYIGALEFHHKDPEQKDFGISNKGHSRSWEVVKNELDKCSILCSNCHKEVHYELSLL